MGFSVNYAGIKRLNERLTALRLNLERPTSLAREQAEDLAVLIQNNLIKHQESGLLSSAFNKVVIFREGTGIVAVGVGDPNILTRPVKAPKGTIQEFVNWLREQRAKRWESFRSHWGAVREKRTGLQKQIKAIKAKERARIAKIHKAERRKLSPRTIERAKKQLRAQMRLMRKGFKSSAFVSAKEQRAMAEEYIKELKAIIKRGARKTTTVRKVSRTSRRKR